MKKWSPFFCFDTKSAIFWHLKMGTFGCLGAVSPLYEAQISNCSLSVVYGSITLKFFRGLLEPVCTSGSTDETKLKK